MKLSEIQIKQFRLFRSGLEVQGLEPGITIFHGPNESGKSTLAHAIRTAFFERHSSGTLSDLQPWGDSAATPEVSLTFEFEGRTHHLIKRFVRQKRCDLNVDGQLFNGDEAEHYLARLMGYSVPARGASKPEHWGVPGLLWIEQGAGHQLQAPVSHANEHLQGILNDAMGHVASSDGDRILQNVTEQLGQLLTRTGAPRQDYRKAIEEEQRLADQLESLDVMIQSYQHDVDQLSALQAEHDRDTIEQPWRAMRQKEREAREQLAHVNVMRDEQRRESEALKACEQTQKLLHQQLETFNEHNRNLRAREQALTLEQNRYQDLTGHTAALSQALEAASGAYSRARESLALSRQEQLRRDKEDKLTQLRHDIGRLRDRRDEATQVQRLLDQDQQRATELRIDPDRLQQLHTLHEKIQELEIRQQTIATRLQFELQGEQTVTLDETVISGQAEHLLLNTALLTIPGKGTVRITPGGDDVAGLAREHARVSQEWMACLEALNVTSLEQARQRSAEYAELTARIRQHQTVLKLHAPQGIEALGHDYADKSAQLNVLQQEYDALPPACERESVDLAIAQANDVNAEQDLRSCEAQLQTHRLAIAKAQTALDAARREFDLAQATVNDADRAATEQQTLQRLNEQRAQEKMLDERIAALQTQIDAVRPDILEQDIIRFGRSAARSQEEYAEREREIRELKGRLQALGTQGLEEQRHALAGQHAVMTRRIDEFARNAAALSLLQSLLREKRQTLTRQLHEPLKQRLIHYLDILFNTSERELDIALSDDLTPVSLTRKQGRAELDELSFGAREQLGLISRLAYADLLKQAGQPTLLMLDDALVHSDAGRLTHMKRILFDAANRHQILLFTCHPEKWRDMGVTPRAIRDLII